MSDVGVEKYKFCKFYTSKFQCCRRLMLACEFNLVSEYNMAYNVTACCSRKLGQVVLAFYTVAPATDAEQN
jgi:hypothetical protein